MQANNQARRPDYQHDGTQRSKSVTTPGLVNLGPLDGNGHPRALQYKRESYQNQAAEVRGRQQ
jgi:hypothetical protein